MDLGIPLAREVKEKEELKNLLKWVNRISRNFSMPEQLEIAYFIS